MKLTQSIICSAFVLSCLATIAGTAEPVDSGFTVKPLAAGVHLIQTDDNNILVSAGEDGVVLVDAGDARVAAKLLATVKSISTKPIRFVIDTHVHGDHTGGNAFFQKLAPVIAHNNVRARMNSDGDDKAPPEAWPDVTFDSEITLHLNGEDIRVLKVPPGHTDGDAVVFHQGKRGAYG